MSILHERLRELRKSKNLTNEAAAEGIGISVRAYRHYETGDREPNVDTLIALADYFGVSVDYLIGVMNKDSE
jgi:Predicted transcriptional regulators